MSSVGGSVAEWLACWTQEQKGPCRVQIAVVTLSGNSLRQTAHIHCASVHQAAKLVAPLLRVAWVTACLTESNGSLPPGLWLTSHAGWLPRTGISSGTLRSVIEYGPLLPFLVIRKYSAAALSRVTIVGSRWGGRSVCKQESGIVSYSVCIWPRQEFCKDVRIRRTVKSARTFLNSWLIFL